MEAVWFAIVTLMLAVYVVLDGYDFGVGLSTAWSPGPTLSDAPSSPPSARSGTGTRCGWWRRAASCSWHFRGSIRPRSAGSTCPS